MPCWPVRVSWPPVLTGLELKVRLVMDPLTGWSTVTETILPLRSRVTAVTVVGAVMPVPVTVMPTSMVPVTLVRVMVDVVFEMLLMSSSS